MNISATISKLISPTIFRLMGIDIFRCNKWLIETERWTLEERNKWRLDRLGDIIEHCWNHVPFYQKLWREHSIKVRRPQSLDDLKLFPVVSRDVFREHREQTIADNLRLFPHKEDSTGGTTGSPLKYYHDLSLHALRYGFVLIGWQFAGYNYGDEVCFIAGGSIISEKRTFRNRCRTWLERGHGVSCVGMNNDVASLCHKMIEKHKPTIIHGYPSMIAEYCNIRKQHNIPAYQNLKSVITTAEMLHPHYRKQIEDSLGVPVFDHYGFNDGGLLSYECQLHKGYHYNDMESILEIVEPDEHGIGRLITTNLWNHSMPFIRYENGDIAALETNSCACGRIYPLIRNVIGRSGDILRFANGKTLGAPGLTLIFKDIPIDAWQVVQTGINNIEIRIKSKHKLKPEHVDYITEVIHRHLDLHVEIKFLYVKDLALTPRGKLKPVFIEMNQ